MQFDTVLERTEAGILEIHQKTNRLTQSERLVLIMTDGRTDIATLIEKLPSMSMPRVFRAIDKLHELGLMSTQLIAPVGSGNANDAILPEVVERFLQQTDLDPATIIRNDAREFDPTTIPHGMLLNDIAAVQPDSELERRLKALVGETPRFARADTTSAVPILGEAKPAVSAQALPKVVPPSMPPLMPPLMPVQAVRPEGVVRTAHHTTSTSNAGLQPNTAAGVTSAPVKSKTAQSAQPIGGYRISPSLRPASLPPSKKSNLGLYLIMGVGLLLVLYAILRSFFK